MSDRRLRGIALAGIAASAACGHRSTDASGEATDAPFVADAPNVDVFDATGHVPKVHRPEAVGCPHDRPPGSGKPTLGDADKSECSTDADCTSGNNGRCTPAFDRPARNICTYDECFVDADCGPDKVCNCRQEAPYPLTQFGHQCSKSTCRTDADCGPGGFCSSSFPPAGDFSTCTTEVGGWFCHTSADGCFDDTDCSPYLRCLHDPVSGHWSCRKPAGCAVSG